jgi:hypothetical protein
VSKLAHFSCSLEIVIFSGKCSVMNLLSTFDERDLTFGEKYDLVFLLAKASDTTRKGIVK